MNHILPFVKCRVAMTAGTYETYRSIHLDITTRNRSQDTMTKNELQKPFPKLHFKQKLMLHQIINFR